MGGVGVKVLGRKRAAVLAVALVSLAAAALADAAVVQHRPASSYQANGTVRIDHRSLVTPPIWVAISPP